MLHDDTIVALSTPPGAGAIAVIRMSGSDALAITEKFFGKKLSQHASHTLHHGFFRSGDVVIDEVVIGIFKKPHSYTGEDVIEISSHGSAFVIRQILHLLIGAGARSANAGEFTMRAFLNGRMDLSQAEAVADLIASGSESAHRAAMNQMRGGFSAEIRELRKELIRFAALIELELDFAEEQVEFANRSELKNLLRKLISKISGFIRSFQLGNVIKNGVPVVIAGRPNAGKSTLLNALLNEERAIVSDIPGTTRDTIEEVINIRGVLFRFIDTAGLREVNDVIEKTGVEKTLEKLRQSSVVLYVFDLTKTGEHELKDDLLKLPRSETKVIAVGNKLDEAEGLDLKNSFSRTEHLVFISAKEKLHLDELRQKLLSLAIGEPATADQSIVTNARHFEALTEALQSLDEVLNGLEQNKSGEFVAADLRQALDALGSITGEVTSDEILGEIFSKFCIGK